MKRVNNKLLIIVPAYNEEKVIEETLKQIKKEIKLIKNIMIIITKLQKKEKNQLILNMMN